MARDETLLLGPDAPWAALRLYSWAPPTISLGYFQRYDDYLRLSAPLNELAVVRRTTGGGAILHDREVTYCLVLAEALPLARKGPVDLYRVAHEAWQRALRLTGLETRLAPEEYPLPTPRTGPFFCFEKPGRTDLLLGERKLLGSAQRRSAGRVLQHGSLILEQRFAAHPGASLGAPASGLVETWDDAFVSELAGALGTQPIPTAWSATQLGDAGARREKYSSMDWLRRR